MYQGLDLSVLPDRAEDHVWVHGSTAATVCFTKSYTKDCGPVAACGLGV